MASATATLERAIDAAQAVGDQRTAALARIRLGRVLRATGELQAARVVVESARRWYDAAGGGEDAALGEYVFAGLDANAGLPQAAERLAAVLANARREGNAEVEVLALDSLAGLHAAQGHLGDARDLLTRADSLIPAVYHLVSDTDRLDRDRARRLLAAAPPVARS